MVDFLGQSILARDVVTQLEENRSQLVTHFEGMKSRGRTREVVRVGAFLVTFVLELSGAMVVVQDPNGDESLIFFPEVCGDPEGGPPELDDYLRVTLCVAALRSLMTVFGLNFIMSGGCSVRLLSRGMEVRFGRETVIIDESENFSFSGVDQGKLFAVLGRLRAAAEAYHVSSDPGDPSAAA